MLIPRERAEGGGATVRARVGEPGAEGGRGGRGMPDYRGDGAVGGRG